MSDADPKPEPTPTPKPTPTPAPPPDPVEDREHLERSNEVLLTTSSILAGFALTGLAGLVDAGPEASQALGRTMSWEPSVFAFPVSVYGTLVATLSFLGVLIGIVSSRLGRRRPTDEGLRRAVRFSVAVYGFGLAALACSTITIAVPTTGGIVLGLVGGGAISLGVFRRGLHIAMD